MPLPQSEWDFLAAGGRGWGGGFPGPVRSCSVHSSLWQVLRLLNLTYYPKQPPTGCPPSLGFPQLEELCLATTAFSYVDNHMLWRILSTSSRLRVLDLRGCVRVTPEGLEQLPCPGGCRRAIPVPRQPVSPSPGRIWA